MPAVSLGGVVESRRRLPGERKAVVASASKSRRGDRRWVGRRLGDGAAKERVFLPWGGGESSAAPSRPDLLKKANEQMVCRCGPMLPGRF